MADDEQVPPPAPKVGHFLPGNPTDQPTPTSPHTTPPGTTPTAPGTTPGAPGTTPSAYTTPTAYTAPGALTDPLRGDASGAARLGADARGAANTRFGGDASGGDGARLGSDPRRAGADRLGSDARTALTAPSDVTRQQLSLGAARPLAAPIDHSLRKASPRPASGPAPAGSFGAPPPAPLPGAPTAPLQGTSRPGGGSRPVGWNTSSVRTGLPQYASQPPDMRPPRQFSRVLVATLSAIVLIVLGGGVIASYKMMDPFDSSVENPLSRPSIRPSEDPAGPAPAPPQPTKTVTVQPVPDDVRVKKNKLYTVGKLPSVKCAEPKIKPTSQANVLKYYQALLPCLNETWEPLVLKAGYPFRQPKLRTATAKTPTKCVGETTVSYYCPTDESISMLWQYDVKNYKQSPIGARGRMLDTLAHEYSHHVQTLTNIAISSRSRQGWMKTEAAKLEENRRYELQASCLGATFLGANQNSLGLRGNLLKSWEFDRKHSGDEYNPEKIRDHGSRKSQWAWTGPAFKSANPASCNTFTAPSAKVS